MGFTRLCNQQRIAGLTVRERMILRRICDEKVMKEIAIDMKLSKRTVEGVVLTMKKNLEVVSITGLVKYAIKNNIYEIS